MSGDRLYADRAVFISAGNMGIADEAAATFHGDEDWFGFLGNEANMQELYRRCANPMGCHTVVVRDAGRWAHRTSTGGASPIQMLLGDFCNLSFVFTIVTPPHTPLRIEFGLGKADIGSEW